VITLALPLTVTLLCLSAIPFPALLLPRIELGAGHVVIARNDATDPTPRIHARIAAGSTSFVKVLAKNALAYVYYITPIDCRALSLQRL
jgi:hypothetical protein